MTNGEWVRWVGSVAATVALSILLINRGSLTGSDPDDVDILFYLCLCVLPCFITAFLTAFGRFWWGFAFGLWISFKALDVCLDEEASPTSVVLLLSAATICCTPVWNPSYRKNQRSEKESAQQPPERDK